jgi:hypothetical protein
MALCACVYSKTIKYAPNIAVLSIITTAVANVYNSQQTNIQDIQEQETTTKEQKNIKSQPSSSLPQNNGTCADIKKNIKKNIKNIKKI